MYDIDIAKKFNKDIGEEYYTAIQFLELSEETAILKFRQVAELLTYHLSNHFKIEFSKESFYTRIKVLTEKKILNEELKDSFHKLRILCNNSIHKYDLNKDKKEEILVSDEDGFQKKEYSDIKEIRELVINILKKVYSLINQCAIPNILPYEKMIEHSSIPNEALLELDYKKKMKAGLWYEAKAKLLNDTYKGIIPTNYAHQLDYFYKLALVNYEAAYKISAQVDNKISEDSADDKYKKYSDIEALFKYSLFLSHGYFGESEALKGYELLDYCIKRGHSEALLHCGIYAYNKLEDFETAYQYFIEAKELNNSLCYLYLYFYFSDDKVQKKDSKLAYENLIKLYELDSVDAAYFLGQEYFEGEIIAKDIEKSKKYLQEAISKGKFQASIYYQLKFENLAKNIANSFKKLKKEFDKYDIKKITINEKKVNRNELCLCGSGKKYKKCCLKSSDSKYKN